MRGTWFKLSIPKFEEEKYDKLKDFSQWKLDGSIVRPISFDRECWESSDVINFALLHHHFYIINSLCNDNETKPYVSNECSHIECLVVRGK